MNELAQKHDWGQRKRQFDAEISSHSEFKSQPLFTSAISVKAPNFSPFPTQTNL
jgi:hypothetical protein